MKKSLLFLSIICCALSCTQSFPSDNEPKVLEPRTTAWEEVLADPLKAAGQDNVYDLSAKELTPAPRGYQATYISHYGRHGSRLAYNAKTYTVLLEMLLEAKDNDNITERGEELLNQLSDFWVDGKYIVGDLTPLGWEQHQGIAKAMVQNFPAAFRKGSKVDACSSPATRSIVSMSAFLSSLSREAPKTEIYAHQSILDVQACRPNLGPNPFRYKGPDFPFPYTETTEEFLLRKYPDCPQALENLFKDPVAAIGDRSYFEVFFQFYLFISGIHSLPESIHFDVDGLVTPEQYTKLWEVFNYESYTEYYAYRTACCAIVDDIIDKADRRLAEGSRGADLRFGHDHSLLGLLMVLDLDGFGHIPASADELPLWFQNFRSPMAANVQFVFYTPKNGREGITLVKVLLNGEEAILGDAPQASWPYYYWDDVRDWLIKRTYSFVTH